jgi:hypothetical protein
MSTVIETRDLPDLGPVDHYGGSWLKKLMEQPPSAARTLALVKRLGEDVQRLPVADGAPVAVVAAYADMMDALTKARTSADAIEQARQEVEQAHQHDVGASAGALKKGGALVASALRKPAALVREQLAVATLLGAERLMLDTHATLTAAVSECWQEWRTTLIADAATATDEASAAMTRAAVVIETRGVALARVLALDFELVRRLPDEAEAAGVEVVKDGVGRVRPAGRPRPDRASEVLEPAALVAKLEAHLTTTPSWALPLTGLVGEQEEEDEAERQPAPAYVVNR